MQSSADQTSEPRKREALRDLAVGDSFNPFGNYQIWKVIRGSHLSAVSKLIYEALTYHAGMRGDCFPSLKTLARETGVSVRRAQECLRELEQGGLVRRLASYRSYGTQTSNRYEFLWAAGFESKLEKHPESTPASPDSRVRQSAPLPAQHPAPLGVNKPAPLPCGHQHPYEAENVEDHHPQAEKYISPPQMFTPLSGANSCCTSYEKPDVFVSPSVDDDDRLIQLRAPIKNDPEAEFCARLMERRWLNGPIANPSALVLVVNDGLQYDSALFEEFLTYELALTTAEKIKCLGAHYRTLVIKFHVARRQRQLGTRRKMEREMIRKREPIPVPCPLLRCNGRGEVYKDTLLVGVCECAAGQNMPLEVKALIMVLNGAA